MEVISFSLDPSERYTFWTGLSGGLFLALSYFGTDQSQVQRYIGGKSIRESRLGLMFNAILKIPMQFFILLTGVLVFLFFEFHEPPTLFNQNAVHELRTGNDKEKTAEIEADFLTTWNDKRETYNDYIETRDMESFIETSTILDKQLNNHRQQLQEIYRESHDGNEAKESDYVFLYYILNYLPHGIIGLLLCVIISAAMSSTSGEINALAATSVIDFYKRLGKSELPPKHQLYMSKLLTFIWGIFAILFALFAQMVENLIEAVNILGSLFYGTILGVFLVAFFFKWIRSNAVFYAAVLSQCMVITLYLTLKDDIAYLWHNVIGCFGVMIFSMAFSLFERRASEG